MTYPGDPYGQQPHPPPYGHPQYPPPPPYGYPYGYPPHGAPPRPKVSPPATGWVLLVAAVVAVVGSFTPWVTVNLFGESVSKNGTEGDGVITVVCAIVVLVTGLLIGIGQGRVWTSIVSLVFASFIALTALVDLVDISGRFGASSDIPDSVVEVGYGLWLTLVGGVVALVVSIVALAGRR